MQLWIGDVAIFFGFGKVVKAGAKVLNFSLGSSGSVDGEKIAWSEFVRNLDATLYSCYMSALLSTQKTASTPNLKISHSNFKTATKFAKFFDRLQSFICSII